MVTYCRFQNYCQNPILRYYHVIFRIANLNHRFAQIFNIFISDFFGESCESILENILLKISIYVLYKNFGNFCISITNYNFSYIIKFWITDLHEFLIFLYQIFLVNHVNQCLKKCSLKFQYMFYIKKLEFFALVLLTTAFYYIIDF